MTVTPPPDDEMLPPVGTPPAAAPPEPDAEAQVDGDPVPTQRPGRVELLRNGEVRLFLDDVRVILRQPKARELTQLLQMHDRAIIAMTEVTDVIQDRLEPVAEEAQGLADRALPATELHKAIVQLRQAAYAEDGTPLSAARHPKLLERYEAAEAAGRLTATERARRREIDTLNKQALIEQDAAIGEAMLGFWAEAIALLGGRTIDAGELPAAFTDAELPGKVIQHLRTGPLVRGA